MKYFIRDKRLLYGATSLLFIISFVFTPIADTFAQLARESVSSENEVSTSRINALLVGKSAAEKATIKGREIAKIGRLSRINRAYYDLEIVSMNAINNGVEVFARAWQKNGTQIGFGKDGSVDIERFRIINPPILVPDPTGDVIRTWTHDRGCFKGVDMLSSLSM